MSPNDFDYVIVHNLQLNLTYQAHKFVQCKTCAVKNQLILTQHACTTNIIIPSLDLVKLTIVSYCSHKPIRNEVGTIWWIRGGGGGGWECGLAVRGAIG